MAKDAATGVFEDAKLYNKGEVRKALNLSDRALDSWFARNGVKRIELSKRSIRYLGSALNAALSKAS